MPPGPVRKIVTERLVVRLPEAEDVPAILDFFERNREHLRPWEPKRLEAFYTEEWWRTGIPEFSRQAEEGRSYRFFLFLQGTELVVGYANLSEVVRGALSACFLGYAVDHAHEGRGLMKEALIGVVRFAFEDLALHRVMANYMPHNERSAALLKRLGFRVEGYAYDYLSINGKWEDHVLTSLVAPGP
ncbi:MAG: GNAT family N-acetyltransferase [Fimbriimonadaceae bacterium]|nr:GNAT family N-acetyltransferase [Fimbriimonadaceae bacterium]QYK55685.1 MAG: GNAT family N-acetyltransferase [Fimbriimonadaceae bacterium]